MYCDYGATTPVPVVVQDQVRHVLNKFGNPSSLYRFGDETRAILTEARYMVKKFINAPEDSKVIFTPSGSASNTLAVKGYIDEHLVHPYFSPLLHKSINEYIKQDCRDYDMIKVNTKGFIDLSALQVRFEMNKSIEPFVVIEYANSEIGTIQIVKEVAELTHEYGGKIYVDCTGAIASVPIDVQDLDVDMIGFSAHKLGGLKGCGVLWCKEPNIRLHPIIFGAQEDGLIGGTENIVAIAALSKAIEYHVYRPLDDEFRLELFKRIVRNGWHLAGSRKRRLPNNFYFSIPGNSGEEIMTRLDLQYDIQVSTGSACSSGSPEPSSALKAINWPEDELFSCIRLTFCGEEKPEDILNVFSTIKKVAK
ncbi:cysteine desulfurase family protein [Bacillota bacterium HCP28S3_F12]